MLSFIDLRLLDAHSSAIEQHLIDWLLPVNARDFMPRKFFELLNAIEVIDSPYSMMRNQVIMLG